MMLMVMMIMPKFCLLLFLQATFLMEVWMSGGVGVGGGGGGVLLLSGIQFFVMIV